MSSDRLARAELATSEKSNQQPFGAVAVACPLEEKEQRYRIEVHVVGEDDQPLGDIAVVLRRESGDEWRKITDDSGLCAFTGLDNTAYQLSLIELDQDAWVELGQENLTNPTSREVPENWQMPSGEAPTKAFIHTIIQGECVSKIADRYGFFPQTIWHYPDNAELRKLRHDNLYILNPGDKVVVPARREKSVVGWAGKKMVGRRKGVPESLRIRFLRHDERPMTGVPYLASVKTHSGDVVPAKEGNIDESGFVELAIAPSVNYAQVLLMQKSYIESNSFRLGYVDPIDTLSGVMARLYNLGFGGGMSDEQHDSIIKSFQISEGLDPTGIPDAQMLMLLKQKFGS